MRIYLVQHGEAKSEDDPRRTLTDRGIGEVQKVAESFASSAAPTEAGKSAG